MKFFIIHEYNATNGFFAKFNYILGELCVADDKNLLPFIDYTTPTNIHDYTNTEVANEWEYCFIQKYNYDFVYNSKYEKSECTGKEWYDAHEKIFRNKEVTKKLHDTYLKHVIVKPEIFNKINPEIKKYKTLGVHCRRSDMAGSHPDIALNYSTDTFYQKVEKVFKDNNFEKIYLATEEIEIFEVFKERFGNKLFYEDCFRIKQNESPVYKMDSRPLHRTLQQQEVLLDALNLSKCDSFICGISSVSHAVIFINGLKYKEVYYFDEI